MLFERDVSLSRYSTFGIGGRAKYFITVDTAELMQRAIRTCYEEKWHYIVIGKGSNCLFDTRGFNGLVIHNRIDFCQELEPGLFHVGAGYSFSLLGTQTARKGFKGLEFASGIPGSIGGAVYMNAGANGHETCEVVKSVDFIDETGDKITLNRDAVHFAYRTSSFQNRKGAIIATTFSLMPCNEARANQIKIIQYRSSTQPYGDKSAGCVFRNPGSKQPSAGALIEQLGLKGLKKGGASISSKHANFIVNEGDATAEDVMELMGHITKTVKEKTGIDLHAEIRLIPWESNG